MAENDTEKNPPDQPEPPYSIFPKWQRVVNVYIASLAAFASPVSSSIYFPAMLTLAKELNTSLTNINLTITTYLIFQGVAPTIVGGVSDRIGRRPAYFLSFTLFIAANVGLALQTNFVALLILRCLQSCGSSGTTALSSAVVSDVATRQQRGSYIGLASLGSSMGPALGPLIGGLLNHFLGWRSIFWFLAIYGAVMLLIYVLFMPETCRNIVGNGSLPPQPWNRPLIAYLKKSRTATGTEPSAPEPSSKKRPGILSSLPILAQKETFLILFYAGLVYAGFIIILTGLPQQLATTYRFNSVQVGLCYLPIGLGPLLIRPVIGRIMDGNFRRHARARGIALVADRQPDIAGFPVERARLELSLASVYVSSGAVVAYGWVMGRVEEPPLGAVLVLLFVVGMCTSAAVQPVAALVIDLHPGRAAAAAAAFNLVRCALGAGAVGLVDVMLERLGRGWTGTLIAGVWVGMSGCWWVVIAFGVEWRRRASEA